MQYCRDIDEVSESFDQDALVTPELKKKKKKSEFVFELGGKKKVSVGHYKGTILVNIREYYTDQKTGELKVQIYRKYDLHADN